MTCIEKQTQDHKQLFITYIPNSELKEYHHQFNEACARGCSLRLSACCPLKFQLPEWQQWASWTMMFLAASTLHLTARGSQYYLWCELQAREIPPESRGGGRKHCKSRENFVASLSDGNLLNTWAPQDAWGLTVALCSRALGPGSHVGDFSYIKKKNHKNHFFSLLMSTLLHQW